MNGVNVLVPVFTTIITLYTRQNYENLPSYDLVKRNSKPFVDQLMNGPPRALNARTNP